MKIFIVLCLVSAAFAEGDLGGYGGGYIAAPIVAKSVHINTGQHRFVKFFVESELWFGSDCVLLDRF